MFLAACVIELDTPLSNRPNVLVGSPLYDDIDQCFPENVILYVRMIKFNNFNFFNQIPPSVSLLKCATKLRWLHLDGLELHNLIDLRAIYTSTNPIYETATRQSREWPLLRSNDATHTGFFEDIMIRRFGEVGGLRNGKAHVTPASKARWLHDLINQDGRAPEVTAKIPGCFGFYDEFSVVPTYRSSFPT